MKQTPITVYSFVDDRKEIDEVEYHNELNKFYDNLSKSYIDHIEAEQEARSVYNSMISY